MSVTIGICAYNEGKNIESLLHDILYDQELPVNSEILVVGSGCTDNTLDIVQKFVEKDFRIKLLIEKERRGKASAVNKILQSAKTDFIIFVSADTMPDKRCFFRLVSAMQKPNVGLVCARPSPINNPKFLTGKLVQMLWSFHDQVFIQFSDEGHAKHASEVFCIRRGIVNLIPKGTVNDDAYIALITKRKGWTISYEPKATVYIRGPETLQDYFRQRRRVIFGHYQVKKLTGESPQYFTALIGSTSAVRNLLSVLSNKDQIFTLLTFVLIECTSNLAATMDRLFKKSHSKWKIASTTKKVITADQRSPNIVQPTETDQVKSLTNSNCNNE
jgi:cellulose synthase/poly-beta-1,6-N-acetylglucosamine synthase-like glycosyltransferase